MGAHSSFSALMFTAIVATGCGGNARSPAAQSPENASAADVDASAPSATPSAPQSSPVSSGTDTAVASAPSGEPTATTTTTTGTPSPTAGNSPPSSAPSDPAADAQAECTAVAAPFEERVRAKFNECYQAGKKKNPELAGTIKVTLNIDAKGKVGKYVPAPSELDKPVFDCMLKALKKEPFDGKACKGKSVSVSKTYGAR